MERTRTIVDCADALKFTTMYFSLLNSKRNKTSFSAPLSDIMHYVEFIYSASGDPFTAVPFRFDFITGTEGIYENIILNREGETPQLHKTGLKKLNSFLQNKTYSVISCVVESNCYCDALMSGDFGRVEQQFNAIVNVDTAYADIEQFIRTNRMKEALFYATMLIDKRLVEVLGNQRYYSYLLKINEMVTTAYENSIADTAGPSETYVADEWTYADAFEAILAKELEYPEPLQAFRLGCFLELREKVKDSMVC